MCRSCRGFGCVWEGEGIVCNECDRVFKNQACYDRHKNEPINGGGRTVCQVIRKCEKCGKPMDVRQDKGRGTYLWKEMSRHAGLILTKKIPTTNVIYNHWNKRKRAVIIIYCFSILKLHKNTVLTVLIYVLFTMKRERWHYFKGKIPLRKFCQWLFTPEHKGCIVVAHNFQGYDGYFIKSILIENAIHYEIIYRGAKSLSIKVPDGNIRFIDSINFIPMSLAKFPKTFGQDELCKGYFPHMFNKDENQNYVGPIPCQNDYGVNFMKPGEREAFIAWHDEQVANNYRYDFREEIIKYCRSDVDILRKCCLLYREMFRKETDIDPFNKALTIASYCQEVYRTNFLKKDTIAVFNNDRQWKIKQSNVAVKWLSYISEKEDYTSNT